MNGNGNAFILFKDKMKSIKKVIREWASKVTMEKSSRKKQLIQLLSGVDKVLEDGIGDAQAAINRRNIIAEIWSLDQADFKDVVQKAKVKWNIKADENSKFFHRLINRQRNQLSIKGI